MTVYDVTIVGAGAAGMMCAAECARRGRRTLVIEHTRKAGEKIRISGGGRCNFTNLDARPEAFLSANPHFCKSALSRYTQHDFIGLVDAYRIDWHEKTLGQLFCDKSAMQIIDMLLAEMSDAELRLNCSIETVEQRAGAYHLSTNQGAVTTEALVIASGGKSIPKIGASGFGYQVARQFGLNVLETRAGLVPFTLSKDQLEAQKPLVGVAAEVNATAGGATFEEALLFTHRGLSGPAALQASSYWREGEELILAFGDADEIFEHLKEARRENGRQALQTALAEGLPRALAQHLAAAIDAPDRLADMSNAKLQDIAKTLTDWRIQPLGTEGYRTAEVTLGGVDTDELNSKTMEARKAPGLFFIGEVVDVTGWLGGYNFQWAWSSGWAAGQVA